MMNRGLPVRCGIVLLLLISNGATAEPEDVRPYVVYSSEGLKSSGAAATRWDPQVTRDALSVPSLTQVFGHPQAYRVTSAGQSRTVLRLDGRSALWQTAERWGSLLQGRTVLVLARVAQDASGFLFDGSTSMGMARAQVRAGQWQVGTQLSPITNADLADPPTHAVAYESWQVHSFSFPPAGQSASVTHGIAMGDQWSYHEAAAGAAPLRGFIVGTNAATRHGLTCDVAEIRIYPQQLSSDQQKTISRELLQRWPEIRDLPADQQPRWPGISSDPRVFHHVIRRGGDDGVHTYRIPGLATSRSGTLLAVYDMRHANGADLPGDIDVGLMRSTDQGKTWSPQQVILDFDRTIPGSKGNGVGDPAILVDQQTGTIFVAALWSLGDRAWNGSGPGLTPQETGQLVLTRSNDDGVTWSPPINVTSTIRGRDPKWRLVFNGPGSGIQLRDGTLVFAAQYREASGPPHSCFLSSRDHGATWTLSPAAIPHTPPTSESQIAECADGSLLLTMRDESRSGQRVWARWTWNTEQAAQSGRWSEPWHALPDPTCMASLIRHPLGELLFSNPNSSAQRVALTIRASSDDGQHWSPGQLLDARGCMYSCMTVLEDGQIGILYEVVGTLTFARFPREWVTDDRGVQSDSGPVHQ
ncbi:MAG: exo-alpha-sialidase [Planctomycetota bacterium]|nr:MAG: exo-alpha-sialidase [Planctomycetota bacterium]